MTPTAAVATVEAAIDVEAASVVDAVAVVFATAFIRLTLPLLLMSFNLSLSSYMIR